MGASPALAQPWLQRHRLGTTPTVTVDSLAYISDGLRVKARLYLPKDTARPLPLVIFCHDGIGGISASHHRSSLSLAARGYAVISPSYRGEDGSEGTVEIAKGEVNDVLNLWPVLPLLPEVDSQRTVLMGASHGALISLLACAKQPQIKGLIFAYGVADIYGWWDYLKSHNKLGKDQITRQTYGDGPQARPQSFALRHGLSAVPRITCPTLILQGELDDITPPQQGYALHKALQTARQDSKLCLYPHALHGFLVYAPYLTSDVTREEKEEAQEAWQEVNRFLTQVLK